MLDKFAMGQCTSNELPPEMKQIDLVTVNAEENSIADKASEESQETPVNNFKSKKHRKSRRNSAVTWVSKKLQRKQESKDLSAAFNLLDQGLKSNLVNINEATEEELMTLEGINRQLAKNIVDYRNVIGGFRRVIDLALVSGIGASTLQNIKSDITLKKSSSHLSSRTHSCDSIPSCESLRSQKSSQSLKTFSLAKVNVNEASIFDLMMVRGMTQEMAANIVHYRPNYYAGYKPVSKRPVNGTYIVNNHKILSKRGNFSTIDDLVKVRGMNIRVLRVIRGRLTCNNEVINSSNICHSPTVLNCDHTINPISPVRMSCHRRTHSAPLDNRPINVDQVGHEATSNRSHRFSSEFSADLFELLSLRSERPFGKKTFTGYHNGTQAIRIGSWNVQQLTIEKINNPGVLEVICRTILETGFSVLALQEVTCREVLNKICYELNEGSLRRVKEWNGPKGEWCWELSSEPSYRSQARTEFMAFIYNRKHGVQITNSCLLQVHNNNNCKINSALIRKPYIGYFTVNNLSMAIVNLQLQTKHNTCPVIDEEEHTLTETPSSSDLKVNSGDFISPLIPSLKEKLEQEKYVLLLGNFLLQPQDRIFDILQESSHCPVIPSDAPTDISYDKPKGSECLDNIWLSLHCQKLNTGSWGVIREGLSHMAIPRGWGWGGMVSDHCPIFCDLFAVHSDTVATKELP